MYLKLYLVSLQNEFDEYTVNKCKNCLLPLTNDINKYYCKRQDQLMQSSDIIQLPLDVTVEPDPITLMHIITVLLRLHFFNVEE